VSISQLTVTDGYQAPPSAYGGGIWNESILYLFTMNVVNNMVVGDVSMSCSGGGIANSGELYIQDCTIDGNTASDPDFAAFGGGIRNYTDAILEVTNSTISNNLATGDGAFGGGCEVFDAGTGYAEFTNCTISANSVVGTTTGYAGGLYGYSGVTVTNCTIVDNSSNDHTGGIISGVASGVTLQNTIIANNTAPLTPDASGDFVSLDYNLIEDPSGTTFTGSTSNNITGGDPVLGPLADNGGNTWTHAVLTGSPALNYIPPASCPVYNDQRNVPRPQQSLCEIGAYEKTYFMAESIFSSSPSPTNADTVSFLVGFNFLAIDFDDESDLVITETGTVAHTGSNNYGGGMNFPVEITGITGDGTITLAVSTTSDVVNDFGEPLEYSVTSSPIIIDNTGPSIVISAPDPLTTETGPVDYTITYSDAVAITLTDSDITLNTTGGVAGTVGVSGIGLLERTVTISGISGTGSLNISIAADTAEDSLGNLSGPAGPSQDCTVGSYEVPFSPWSAIVMLLLIGAFIGIRPRG